MKFETVRIHFILIKETLSICCHPEILLPWQRDVTNSPLYHRKRQLDILRPNSTSEGRIQSRMVGQFCKRDSYLRRMAGKFSHEPKSPLQIS